MGRGGAQRVMNNLITEFSKENDVVLINDVFLEQSNEYDICDSIKRINLGVSNGGIFGNLKRVLTDKYCKEVDELSEKKKQKL